jgi:hypothetical protein
MGSHTQQIPHAREYLEVLEYVNEWELALTVLECASAVAAACELHGHVLVKGTVLPYHSDVRVIGSVIHSQSTAHYFRLMCLKIM